MGGESVTNSQVYPTHICVQERCIMDPDPNRRWDSSSPLIQECKCRWKCVPLMMGLHRQGLPLSAVKGTLARTLPARSLSPPQISPSNPAAGPSARPRSTALSSFWDWSLQLESAETLFGMANAPCLPPTEQEQAHKQLCSANALQHPDLPSVNHSLDFSLWALSKTTDI